MSTKAMGSKGTRIIFFLFASVVTFSPVLAHGVSARELDAGVCIEFQYDDRSPLSYCEVKLFEPGQPDSPNLEGLTDSKGRYLFYPEKSGTWTLQVSDGMGHGMVHEVDILDASMGKRKPTDQQMPRSQKVMIGLAFIFGLTGIGTFAASIREKRGV